MSSKASFAFRCNINMRQRRTSNMGITNTELFTATETIISCKNHRIRRIISNLKIRRKLSFANANSSDPLCQSINLNRFSRSNPELKVGAPDHVGKYQILKFLLSFGHSFLDSWVDEIFKNFEIEDIIKQFVIRVLL